MPRKKQMKKFREKTALCSLPASNVLLSESKDTGTHHTHTVTRVMLCRIVHIVIHTNTHTDVHTRTYRHVHTFSLRHAHTKTNFAHYDIHSETETETYEQIH